MVWYIRSWNCAWRDLNPVVFAFAMLFAIVSTFSCCAFIPLAALKSARINFFPPASAYLRDFLYRLPSHFARDGNGLLHHFELPHHGDEAHRGLRGIHVRRFQSALLHLHIGRVLRSF